MNVILKQAIFAALALSFAGGAQAAPATEEGAARVKAALQKYLGATEGVVTVTPSGEVYDLTVDLAPLVAGIAPSAVVFSLSRQHLSLSDQGGGLWDVKQDEPFDLALDVPGKLTLKASAASMTMTGTFDESLMAFRDWVADFGRLSVAETVTEASAAAPTDLKYTIETLHSEALAAAASGGGLDGTMTGTMTGLREDIAIPAPAGGQPVLVALTVQNIAQNSEMKGVRAAPMLDLLAWFVAHPSEGAITAGQEELRKLAGAALPLFNSVSGSAIYEGVSVDTPLGSLGIGKITGKIDANGVVADGRFREAVAVEGVTVPRGVVPDWAAPLMPTHASFDAEGSGFNLADPAAMIVHAFDLTADPPIPEAMAGPLLSAFLPEGRFDLRFAPSEIRSPLYAVAYEGGMAVPVGAGAVPTGQGKVTMTGMDAVLDALNKAPPEMGQPAIQGLMKTGAPGQFVWNIDATMPGKVMVNSVDLSALGAQ